MFLGALGGSPNENAKNGFIGSVTPIIKKSLPYESQKIANEIDLFSQNIVFFTASLSIKEIT